jgi:hypothetical protein
MIPMDVKKSDRLPKAAGLPQYPQGAKALPKAVMFA